MNALRLFLQIALPFAVLGGGGFLVVQIAKNATKPRVVDQPPAPPLVRVATAASLPVRLDVATQGTVEPLRVVDLSAEVGGRIVATNDALRAGGTFHADEVLLTLDPTDFDLAIKNQEATVARAELRLLQEQAEADAAVRAWRQLEGDRPADPLVTRSPQIRDAEASLAAARATLAKSRLDRSRTEVKAPFTGRVRSVHADQGQTVQPGQRLAVILDDTTVEVRLPVPVGDAAFVELPLLGAATGSDGPLVDVTAEFAGRQHTWQGRVVRTEGEIDRRTRQLFVVARIERARGAAGNGGNDDRPPLLVGQFVQASIHGRSIADAIVIPRAALRPDGTVWVVDGERRLRRRTVDVLRVETERVLLHAGLGVGDQVCLSTLDTAGDGSLVTLPPPRTDK